MQKTGIGTDIVEISRFEESGDAAFSAFLQKNFTPKELEYCRSKERPAPHLAARFAGKEAVIKALCSLGIVNIFYPSIEILNDHRGVPYVRINTEHAENLHIHLSLSHSSQMALAFCIITGEIRNGGL
jgi:holo-[acyl-carrier protein] synthase